ncbi:MULTISPECIES: ArsR/SmtB family transcription factor [Flavobacterium]|uniref:ArsR/SmtB family transcription factor n=1 Tax=Flavobacterium TaxID=237 RepID=UPI002481E495|nr:MULTISPECIES: metalloregulator ArsR/SmtB family transcription factor [Flavobacterium]
MGTTKQLNFDKETKAIAEICKALGHPTRIQIMTILLKKNNRTCGEIVSLIPLAQSTISKHLLELKKADLLKVKNVGKKTIYSIEIDKMQLLKKYLIHFMNNKSILEETSQLQDTTYTAIETKQNLKQYNYTFPDKKNKTE